MKNKKLERIFLYSEISDGKRGYASAGPNLDLQLDALRDTQFFFFCSKNPTQNIDF